jgi:hypothetical protein
MFVLIFGLIGLVVVRASPMPTHASWRAGKARGDKNIMYSTQDVDLLLFTLSDESFPVKELFLNYAKW